MCAYDDVINLDVTSRTGIRRTMATFTAIEQRAYIKIEYYRGARSVEILNTLQSVCGKDALPKTTVYRWIDEFKRGRTDVELKHSPGRPVEATAPENVEKIQELLKTDRRLTCEEVAREIGISRGSAHAALTTNLNMRRIAARWVPHCLSEEQKTERMETAKTLLKRYIKEGESFLNRIVAIDETWIRSYEPELKRQSSEWHTPASPRPIKFRRKQGHLKMMMIFAYDSVGVLVAERIPLGKTVNKEVYSNFLMKKLRPAIRKRRRSLFNAVPLILHDNASCHKSERVTSLLTSYEWDVLPHPPYSPDMSPPDFDLFPKLKEPLRGIRFDDLDELEAEVAKQVRLLNSGCLATGISDLPKRWESVIEKQGCYIEGM